MLRSAPRSELDPTRTSTASVMLASLLVTGGLLLFGLFWMEKWLYALPMRRLIDERLDDGVAGWECIATVVKPRPAFPWKEGTFVVLGLITAAQN